MKVSQPNYSSPGYCRTVGSDGRINTVDAPRGPHIVGSAYQVHLRRPKGAGADAADAQLIALALEVQSTAAAAGDEPLLW